MRAVEFGAIITALMMTAVTNYLILCELRDILKELRKKKK